MKKAKLFASPSAASSPSFQPQPQAPTRPKSGYQSVRGRISSPIPIPNPLDNDDFPIRTPGTAIASSSPIGEYHKQSPSLVLLPPPPLPPPPPPPPVALLVAQTFPAAGRTEVLDVPQTLPEHPSTPTQRQRHDSTAGPSTSSPEGALSRVSASRMPGTGTTSTTTTTTIPPSAAARYSTMSGHSVKTASTGDGGGRNSPPRRKKSTLRSAINKLLRRRRNAGSLSSVSEAGRPVAEEGLQQQSLHRSVMQIPPATRVTADPIGSQPKRVTSMPISEFDRALRSHSVGPEDMTVIGSVRNSIDALNSPRFAEFQHHHHHQQQQQLHLQQLQQQHGRIYSGILQPRSRGEEWGLSPRPASVHHHHSHSLQHHADHDDPDAIGRAITSDSSAGADMGHKRRSRSLSQLDEVALEQIGNGRRRSDEIRYWRQSYDITQGPLSPLSSDPEEDVLLETTDAVDRPHAGGQEATTADPLSETKNAVTEAAAQEGSGGAQARGGAAAATTTESPAERPPNTPLQPFEFGPVAVMSEMAGMKITQAVTLEERFTFLEARMNKLERVVTQLCHSVPGFKGPFVDRSMAQKQQRQQQQQQTAASTPSVAGPSTPFHPTTTSTTQPPTSAIARVPTQRVQVNQPTYAYSTVIRPMIPSIYQSEPGEEDTAGYDGARADDGDASSSRYTTEHDGHGDNDDNTSSRMSFADANTYYFDSLHPPSSSATQAVSTTATSAPGVPSNHDPFLPALFLRPTSETTIRPANSMPSLLSGSQSSSHGGGGGAVVGYAIGDERGDGRSHRSSNTAVLVTQLDAERAARQLLEEQVRKLSERLNTLSTTMFAMVRDPGHKGTPVGGVKSSEGGKKQQQQAAVLDNKSQTQLPGSMINTAAVPRTAITTETAPASTKPSPFINTSTIAPSSKAQSIFGRQASASGSGFDSLANSPIITRRGTGDESILLPSPSEEGPFQTPRELPPTPAGVFGDEFGAAAGECDSYVYGDEEQDDDDEGSEGGKARRKVAARVLSLSQLTMGTGLPTRI